MTETQRSQDQKHSVKPVSLYENTSKLRLHSDVMIIIFFVYNVIQTSCFFFLEKK